MTAQSDARTPGRRGSPPASFGREQPPEDFSIKGGHAIHLVVHADVTPSPESLEVLRAAVRDATRIGVLEGYAAALAEMDAEDEPDGPDGGPAPGDPDQTGG